MQSRGTYIVAFGVTALALLVVISGRREQPNYVLPKARLVIIAGRQEVVDELKLTEPTALYPFYWSSERVSAKCA